MTSTEKPLTERPLYQVERDALTSRESAEECARRYAEHLRYSAAYARRLTAAWLEGFDGKPNRYTYKTLGRGGDNYARPLRTAYANGKNFRAAAEGWAKERTSHD